MESNRTIDEVVAEMLATTTARENANSATERDRCGRRLVELRAEAAEIRGDSLSTLGVDELQRRLERCDQKLTEMFGAHWDVSAIGGQSGMGGGLDPMQTMAHNDDVDRAGGREALENERTRLRAEIARRSDTS
jgi:hypothetical protein